MGLAPQVVEEIFEIVQKLNVTQGVSFLLAEQNTNMALKYATYGYILETGRVVMDGAGGGLARERGREGILSRRRGRTRKRTSAMSKATSAANAGSPETPAESDKCVRDDRIFRLPRHPTLSGTRELLFGRLPALLAAAMRSDAYAERFSGVDPSTITTRDALARLPILRKSDLPAMQRAHRPFGGLSFQKPELFRRLFASPGPIFEAQGSSVDPWGVARPMHAMGFRARRDRAEHLQLSSRASRFHDGFRRARARMRGHSSGSRQHRTTVRIDRSLPAQPLLRHARLPQDPSQNGGRYRARRQFSQARAGLRRGLPENLQGEIAEAGIEAFQAYATADIGIIAYETPTRDGMVINENLIVEIVRPGTGNPVDVGEVGEIVVTTLDRGLPADPVGARRPDGRSTRCKCLRTHQSEDRGMDGPRRSDHEGQRHVRAPRTDRQHSQASPGTPQTQTCGHAKPRHDAMTLACEVDTPPDDLAPRIAETLHSSRNCADWSNSCHREASRTMAKSSQMSGLAPERFPLRASLSKEFVIK